MRNIFLIALTIAAIFLGGCWDMIDINEASVVTGVGIDYKDGAIIFTAQFAQSVSLLEAGAGQPLAETITARGQTASVAGRKVMLSSPVFPLWAHTDLIMVGEDLAHHDLSLLGDFLLRNRNLRPDAAVVLARQDTPETLLNVPVPLSPYSATAINEMLNNDETFEGVHVKVLMIDFLSDLATPGIEPVLPQISLSGGNKIYLNGAAVFKGRKMVGSLNEQECRGYRWLYHKENRGGTVTINSPIDKKALSLEIDSIASKIRPVFKGDQLVIEINVDTELKLLEQTGQGNLMAEQGRTQLENLAEQEIKKQIEACVAKSQRLNSDILGFGRQVYRYYPGYWQKAEDHWEADYPKLVTKIRVTSRVTGDSLLKKSLNLRT